MKKKRIRTKKITIGLGAVWLQGCRCRCGHEWVPRRIRKEMVCPKCHNKNWDQPWSEKQTEKEKGATEKPEPREPREREILEKEEPEEEDDDGGHPLPEDQEVNPEFNEPPF